MSTNDSLREQAAEIEERVNEGQDPQEAEQEVTGGSNGGSSGDSGGSTSSISDNQESPMDARPSQDALEEAEELAEEGQYDEASETVSESVDTTGDVSQEQGIETENEQARELEQEFVDQSDAAVARDDVRVGEQDGQLVAQLTDTRQEEIQQQQRISAEVGFERQLSDQLGEDVTAGEEFTVQEEQTEQGVRFTPELTDEFVAQQQPERPASTGIPESEYSGLETDQQPGRRDRDIFSGLVSGTEDALSEVAQVSGGEGTRVEFRGEGSVVNVASQEDTDLTADLGPVSDAGDYLSGVGQDLQQDYIDPAASVAGPIVGQGITGNFGSPSASVASIETGYELSGQAAEQTGNEEAAETLTQASDEIEAGTPGTQMQARFGEGVVGGGASIANVPAIGGTVVDAAEFGVEAGGRTLEGEGGEFAQQAGGQAAVVGAQATQSAAENPAQTTGQLVGGLATSGGAIGGARALGGARAGRAASYAVQPGEEALLSAGRVGIPGARRAASTFSDVSVGESSGLDLTGSVRRSRERLGEATPDVSVRLTRAPNAPPVDVASDVDLPNVRGGIQSRVESGAETARNFPQTARERVRTRQQQAELDVAAARQSARETRERVSDIPSDVRSGVSRTAGRASDVSSDLSERIQSARQQAQIDLAAGEQRAMDVAETVRRAPQEAEQTARRTARDIGEFIGDVEGEASRRASTGLLGDESTGRVQPTSFSGPDVDFEGDITGRVSERVEAARFDATQGLAGLESRAGSVAQRASDAPEQAAQSARRARRNLGEGIGQVRGEATRRASTGLLGDEGTGRMQIPSGTPSNPFEGITDYTLRVDVGRPTPTRVDASDIEIDTDDTTSVFGFDESDAGAGSDTAFESDFEADAPEPQQALAVERGDAEIDASRTGTGTDRQFGGRAIQQDEPAEPTEFASGDTSQPMGMDMGDTVDSAFDVGPTTSPTEGLDTDETETSIIDRVSETRQETDTETGTETRSESRSELRQEQRTESRSEFRFEQRTEGRSEFDLDPTPGQGDNGDDGGPVGTASEDILTDFVNPLTGEAETTSDPRDEDLFGF